LKPSAEYLHELQSTKPLEDGINLDFIYPVVVIAGQMYECQQRKKEVIIEPADHIIFVRAVKSRFIKGEFFVDFVRETYLPRYLRKLDREFDFIKKKLKPHRVELRRNVIREMRALQSGG